MNLFTTKEILEAYEKNDIQIGKDYIRVGDKTERFEKYHNEAVSYIAHVIDKNYKGESPKPELLCHNAIVYDVKLEKDIDLEYPFKVRLNNSTWFKRFQTHEEAKSYYNKNVKIMMRHSVASRKEGLK